jgi:hypothetical protein
MSALGHKRTYALQQEMPCYSITSSARTMSVGPDLSHRLVEVSSVATRVKIMTGVLTEALIGSLAVIWLMRRGIWRRV